MPLPSPTSAEASPALVPFVVPRLRIRKLRKSYGRRPAVAGVDLDVAPGETLGLVGPNGAGKTTTLHLIAGVLRPDAGFVELDGDRDPTRLIVRRRIGIAPQALALYPRLSADENLRFVGRLHGLAGTELDERVEAALDLVGLCDRRHDRVETFSGGMKRRLNLACAVLHGPRVLLLDEPTVGVDPQSRNHLFDSLELLRDEGLTVLYSTHYLEEAERLCDRVAIFDHGRVLAVDTVASLKSTHGSDDLQSVLLTLTGRSSRD